MKTCVIDCGGGLRDIYGAGVFDYCIDNDITFDMCIGISAGSANIASFTSGQRGRNYNFYHEYAFRKEYNATRSNKVYGTIKKSKQNRVDYKRYLVSQGLVKVDKKRF